MKLSKRSEYGLRALLDLAARTEQRPLRLKNLAERNNIPVKFLEQIFVTLRNTGVIRSQVGAHGGYTLGRPAEEITLGQVIRALDGTIAPVGCLSVIAYEPCTCPDECTCPLRAAMNQVRDAIVAVVDYMSLADAVSRGRVLSDVKPQASNANPSKRAGRKSREPESEVSGETPTMLCEQNISEPQGRNARVERHHAQRDAGRVCVFVRAFRLRQVYAA